MHGMHACLRIIVQQPAFPRCCSHVADTVCTEYCQANLSIHRGAFDQHATAGWGAGRSNSLKVRFGIETSLNGAEASSYRAP